MLALHNWGCHVCVVESEQEAVAHLLRQQQRTSTTSTANSDLWDLEAEAFTAASTAPVSPEVAATASEASMGAGQAGAAGPLSLQLQHCGELEDRLFSCSGGRATTWQAAVEAV